MKKILALAIVAGFTLTSCGHTICDAYASNYENDTTIQNSIKVIKDASAEAQG